MAHIKIRKVTTLPATLESSTLYLLNNGGTLSIHVTNSTGSTIHTLNSNTDLSAVLALINSLINQPNGIAGLNSDNQVTQPVINIEGQDITIGSNGSSVYRRLSINASSVGRHIGDLDTRYTTDGLRLLAYRKDRHRYANFSFTLPQDYKVGTDLIIKAVVVPLTCNKTTINSGTAKFSFKHQVSVGNGLGPLIPAGPYDDVDVVIAATTGIASGLVRDIKFSPIPGTTFIPGSVIMGKICRQGNLSSDTFNYDLGALSFDLFYEIGQIGTINIDHDFFN